MDEETKARLAAIEKTLATTTTQVVALTQERDTLKAANEKLEKEAKDREAGERKTKIEFNRKQVNDILETAVKGKLILPAQRESFSKVLKTSDDEAMFAINIEDVKGLIKESGNGKPMKFNREEGRGQGTTNGDKDRIHEDAGEELHRLALTYQDDHPKVAYDIALERVMASNPELASEHIGGLATEEA
jgi:hypothetical protein